MIVIVIVIIVRFVIFFGTSFVHTHNDQALLAEKRGRLTLLFKSRSCLSFFGQMERLVSHLILISLRCLKAV